MAKPSRWLKIDRYAKVRIRIGSKKNLEIRVLVPAKRIKAQLESLQR